MTVYLLYAFNDVEQILFDIYESFENAQFFCDKYNQNDDGYTYQVIKYGVL